MKTLIGRSITSAHTVLVTQALIDKFCAISGDHQWIHEKSDESTIVPGNLLIALIPQLIQTAIYVETYSRCVSAGYQRVKFLRPVHADQSIGLTVSVVNIKQRREKTFVKMGCVLTHRSLPVAEAILVDVYS